MRKAAVYSVVLLFVLAVGFYIGRMTKPQMVRAASAPRIVHVEVSSSWAAIPGYGYGTPVALSCTPTGEGNGDCFVLMQGN